MNQENSLTLQQTFEKRKIRYAVTGIVWAAVAAITWAFQGNLMGVAGGMSPFAGASYTAMLVAVASLATGAIHDFFAGIWILIINLSSGRSLKEYFRLGTTKIGTLMLLAAFFGGTIAAGGNLIGINMCGPTYTLAIAGTSPIVGSILGRIVFKERIRPLAWVGIVIAVAGVITVSYAPPEGDQYPYFAIGLLGAVASSIGCGLEAVCVTYAADMTDSSTACGIYRTFGSSILTLVFLLPAFGILAGDVTTGFRMIGEAFSLGNPVLWIAIVALAGGLSYLTLYKAFPKAGIAKSMTVNVTYTLWSIPIGFAFLALGISDYAITGQAIIGCVVIFIGVVMVIGNPKDLVKLRNN